MYQSVSIENSKQYVMKIESEQQNKWSRPKQESVFVTEL